MIVDSLDRNEYRKFLKNTVLKVQKCQRNWDLNKSIPKEDLDVIIHAATQCPSKQNLDMYSLLVIQNRKIQEEIYKHTWTRPGEAAGRLNPQVLANVLLIFIENEYSDSNRNRETRNPEDDHNIQQINIDRHQAVGVAAGFVNVVAGSLGYSTGCNRCLDDTAVQEILNIKNPILLMMGVGFKDDTRNRRMDHVKNIEVESFSKLPIQVTYIDEPI